MTCILVIIVALLGVNAAKPNELIWFGDMYLVQYRGLILVRMQPKHKNSYGCLTCILLTTAALFGVNAAKPLEFIWIGDMYPVYYCGLFWCECSQAIGIHMSR